MGKISATTMANRVLSSRDNPTHFQLRLRLVGAEIAEGRRGGGELVAAPYFWQEADAEGKFPMLALSTLMRKVLSEYAKVSSSV